MPNTDPTIYKGRILRKRVANTTKPFSASYFRVNGGGTRSGGKDFTTFSNAHAYLLGKGLYSEQIEVRR